MKVLIIGGVAAGTKAAAKLKRLDRSAEITLLTKEKDISYAGCGLPYYIGGEVETREQLVVNTPAAFSALTDVTVQTQTEVTHVDFTQKTVTATDLVSGQPKELSYDKLILAVGASPVVPPLSGKDLNGVFTLRNPDDAVNIRNYVTGKPVKTAVVVGAGFIGLEVAENLKMQGVSVTVIDVASQVLPEILDAEMAFYVKKQLAASGIRVLPNTKANAILGENAVTAVETGSGNLQADLVVLSVGIRPNTAFLTDSGLAMERGRILVDETLATNIPDVYAAGDCVTVKNRITGARTYSAMGSSANMEARTLALALTGSAKKYPGVLGTAVLKLPTLNVARTGLTEVAAKSAGFDPITTLAICDDKPHYMDGASAFITKLIADKTTHKLLGAQVLGSGNVDKMIDIAVTGLNMNATLEDFENGDYAYAPPFSTAIHPFVQSVQILLNKLDGTLVSMTPQEYADGKADDYTVLDVAPAPSIRGAKFADITNFNGEVPGVKKDEKILLVCGRGKRAYMMQCKMRAAGYTNTVVLEGATSFNDVVMKNVPTKLTAADIAKVKALGFLQDKTTPDCFNGRVITRNGKITAEESAAIAEAAKRFGNGEIAMTTRLTVEIQRVPFANIEPLRTFLRETAGLETGGTGSKVRPVVSCKGTTCQYGLIDTFALSEEIHQRFFLGYNNVKLPHKFKIAVGGCPNNCVKPDLNDLGIIGQKVPEIDLDKCRGCKVCQVEKACPIKVAKMENGKIVIDPNACNHCGRCVGKCPFKALTNYTVGYRVYIGGRWGKRVAQGRYLEKVFTSQEEVLDIIEKAILLFRDQGITGERFNDTVTRLGFENVQKQLLSDELLQHKDENLSAQKHLKGGATC